MNRESKPIWLVEIRLKDWKPDLPDGKRIVSFEEVEASSEVAARHAGFDQFSTRTKHEPILRRKMEGWGIKEQDCCAPDAVQIS